MTDAIRLLLADEAEIDARVEAGRDRLLAALGAGRDHLDVYRLAGFPVDAVIGVFQCAARAYFDARRLADLEPRAAGRQELVARLSRLRGMLQSAANIERLSRHDAELADEREHLRAILEGLKAKIADAESEIRLLDRFKPGRGRSDGDGEALPADTIQHLAFAYRSWLNCGMLFLAQEGQQVPTLPLDVLVYNSAGSPFTYLVTKFLDVIGATRREPKKLVRDIRRALKNAKTLPVMQQIAWAMPDASPNMLRLLADPTAPFTKVDNAFRMAIDQARQSRS